MTIDFEIRKSRKTEIMPRFANEQPMLNSNMELINFKEQILTELREKMEVEFNQKLEETVNKRIQTEIHQKVEERCQKLEERCQKLEETLNKRIQTEIDKKFEIPQNPQTKKPKTTIQDSKSEETFETKSLIKKDVMTQEEKLEIITAAESFGSEKLNWDVIVELCPICRSNNRKKSTMKSFYSRHLNK